MGTLLGVHPIVPWEFHFDDRKGLSEKKTPILGEIFSKWTKHYFELVGSNHQLPAPPKRCQYDPKGWLMGTPYHSFGTP